MKPIIRILGIAMVLALGQSLIMSLGLFLSQPARAEVPKFIPSRSHCTDPKLVHVPQKLTPAQCDKWFKFETKHAKNLQIFQGKFVSSWFWSTKKQVNSYKLC